MENFIYYTGAPASYDIYGVTELESDINNWRKVSIPSDKVMDAINRYASGNYGSFTEEQARRLDFLNSQRKTENMEQAGNESEALKEINNMFETGKVQKTIKSINDIPKSVRDFMPPMQQRVIIGNDEIYPVIEKLQRIIEEMPSVYGQEDTETEDKIVYLHYFYGSSDWYIVEKDSEPEQLQAYGYAILNGDTEMAEWGYINIEELKEIGKVELDFYWKPKKFKEVFPDEYAQTETEDVSHIEVSEPDTRFLQERTSEPVEVVVNEIQTEINKSPLEEIKPQNTVIQDLSYKPVSKSCLELETTVPFDQRYDLHKAIETVDRRVNGVDEYVAEKLGYVVGSCTMEQRKEGLKCLCDALGAEQVDAIAMAIYNIEQKGQGIIIGDQTGIGKGRSAAGMIRYAIKRGMKPIFLTVKDNLFSDIYRDLIAIGADAGIPLKYRPKDESSAIELDEEEAELDDEPIIEDGADDEIEEEISSTRVRYRKNDDFKKQIRGKKRLVPYILNGKGKKTNILDSDLNILYEGLPPSDNKKVIESLTIPKDCDLVVATYSQFGKKSKKWEFLKSICRNNIVIMDESHIASGSSNTGGFLRSVLEETSGVVFLSATFAKRPDNMPIYVAKTCLSDANMNSDQVVEAIQSGGVALQQIISSGLVLEGQYMRRQRSYEGIEVNYLYLDSTQQKRGYPNLDLEQQHKAIMDRATDLIREIIAFQQDYISDVIDEMDEAAKGGYGKVKKSKGTESLGIKNSPAFSGVFNIINQLLFSIKAQAVADVAIQRLKEGKKPIIGFANTMESFLNDLTDVNGKRLVAGDTINSDFSKIFERRLKSILKYSEDAVDEKTGKVVRLHKYLDVSDQTPAFQMEYYRILNKIKATSIGICSSPIDVLYDRIQKAGYSVNEVTGRKLMLKLNNNGTATLKNRNKLVANVAFQMFNDNDIDCLLINTSGSTGASAHAVPTNKVPKDKIKQRVMIILQPELDINVEVQKRGRINRTGQVYAPIYDYVISAIPAEKRLMMMFQKKLKSLDANTSSNQRESGKLADEAQVDFLNKYGDEEVYKYLVEDPHNINGLIDDPLKMGKEKDEVDKVDAASRVAGRVAVLACKQQEEFYTDVTQRYNSTIELLNELDENDLEVINVDLKAETQEKEIAVAGKGSDRSIFGRHSILEKCSVDNLRKPYAKTFVDELLKQSLGGFTAEGLKKSQIEKIESWFNFSIESEEKELNENYDNVIAEIKKSAKEKKQKALAKGNKEGVWDEVAASWESERIEETNETRVEAIKKMKEKKLNQKNALLQNFSFFTVGRVIAYPSIYYAMDNSHSKGIFLGFVINENVKNPYAASAIKLRFAIASSQRYLAIPLSKYDEIAKIKDATVSQIFFTEQNYTLENWDEICKKFTSDRVTRYIVTGNIFQAYGNEKLKGKLISYTTIGGGLKKGILLPDDFSTVSDSRRGKEGMKITVAIKDAMPIIKSLTGLLTTNNEITIQRRGDDFAIIVPAANARGGQFYLDTTILALVDGNKFEKSGRDMVAKISLNKIENLIEYLDYKFKTTVNLPKSLFNSIKDNFIIEDYTDEEQKPLEDVVIEKLTEVDREAMIEKQRRELEEQQLETQKQFEEEQRNREESERFEIEKKKLDAKRKLIKLLAIFNGTALKAKGGSLTDELEADKHKAYSLGIAACKEGKMRVPAHDKECMVLIKGKGHNAINAIFQAWHDGYFNENEKRVRAMFPKK